MISQQGCREP